MIAEHRPKAVFVDLAAGPLVAPESWSRFRRTAGPETPFIAFGSHVDAQALAAARKPPAAARSCLAASSRPSFPTSSAAGWDDAFGSTTQGARTIPSGSGRSGSKRKLTVGTHSGRQSPIRIVSRLRSE